MKKIHNTCLISLAIAMFAGFGNSMILHGMEQPNQKAFNEEFKALPLELKQKIKNLMLQDALLFLGLQPLTIAGHAGPVMSGVMSNNKVITGSEDRTAKIWNFSTGQLLHTLRHTGPVRSVAICSDKVVTGSEDRTAKIWDLATGQLLHTLAGHTNAVFSVAISGDKVVTRSFDDTIKIWDLATGHLLNTLARHTAPVYSAAVNDAKAITGLLDGTAKIWPLALDLKGTPQTNPLVWVMYNATPSQANFITRAYQATIGQQDLIIDLPVKLGTIQKNDSPEQIDGNIYFSFPDAVRAYLRNRLNIRKPQSGFLPKCVIQ